MLLFINVVFLNWVLAIQNNSLERFSKSLWYYFMELNIYFFGSMGDKKLSYVWLQHKSFTTNEAGLCAHSLPTF